MEDKGTHPALLFMPDISGFTQFVNETETSHSQHIIEELLETMIDSNILGMKISEIEGDAILFYKAGELPPIDQLAEQFKRMFIAFHLHLRKYDLSRICNCGACSTANKLTLKIVAHYGNVSFSKIKDHTKLFGADVILIHRLLKNNVEVHEYMMVTENIPIHLAINNKDQNWIELKSGSNTYDLGEVKYLYSHFKSLYKLITDPPKPKFDFQLVKKPMLFTIDVNAPMDFVHAQLIDIRNRSEVLPGVTGVEVEDERHNKIDKLGTVHKCIRDPDNGPAITSASMIKEDRMAFTETSLKHHGSFEYIVDKISDEKCRLTFAVHMQMNFISKIMFDLMAKKKFVMFMNLSTEKIKLFNEKKYNEMKQRI